jgi:hypothetical protein
MVVSPFLPIAPDRIALALPFRAISVLIPGVIHILPLAPLIRGVSCQLASSPHRFGPDATLPDMDFASLWPAVETARREEISHVPLG